MSKNRIIQLNNNRPKKGQVIKVHPIKNASDIKLLKEILKPKPMHLFLFVVGINTNLRASDLRRLTVRDFEDKKPGDEIHMVEKKSKQHRIVIINDEMYKAWLIYKRDRKDLNPKQPLFGSVKGPWTVSYIHSLVKKWCTNYLRLPENYGSHTLRKTWGYHQRVQNDVSIPILMRCFNHSSQKQTLEYLCICDEEIKRVFMNGI